MAHVHALVISKARSISNIYSKSRRNIPQFKKPRWRVQTKHQQTIEILRSHLAHSRKSLIRFYYFSEMAGCPVSTFRTCIGLRSPSWSSGMLALISCWHWRFLRSNVSRSWANLACVPVEVHRYYDVSHCHRGCGHWGPRRPDAACETD